MLKKSLIVMTLAALAFCGGPKDKMNTPYDVTDAKVKVNYMVQKISDVGDVRWYAVDLDKGDKIEAKVMVPKKVGVQLHIDLMSGDEKPTLIKKGKDDKVDSRVKAKIKKSGKYYFRVFDRGMDNETSGLLSGYTFYISKR